MYWLHLFVGIIVLAMSQRANSSKPKAILPESLAQNGKTMRNIKKWSIDDICIYNEANMHQKQFALVKYSCEQVGQRMSTKRHAENCGACDVSDLRIEVMDRENKEWIEARGDDKFVGFQKGKGTKRKKKKQKDPKQPGLAHWWGQKPQDAEEKKPTFDNLDDVCEDDVRQYAYLIDDGLDNESDNDVIVDMETRQGEDTSDKQTNRKRKRSLDEAGASIDMDEPLGKRRKENPKAEMDE
eukprot:1138835_1